MGHKGGVRAWRGVVAHVAATTCWAPASSSARAASASVAPVVTTSSTTTQVAPATAARHGADTAMAPREVVGAGPAVEVRLVGHPPVCTSAWTTTRPAARPDAAAARRRRATRRRRPGPVDGGDRRDGEVTDRVVAAATTRPA